jgi:hypothetical protein
MSKVASINARLPGFTSVRRLCFEDESDGRCTVELVLVHERETSRTITLKCLDVVALRITAFGGGLTQIACLKAMDIRDQQLDRQNYAFVDLEHDTVSWRCRDVEVI